MSNAWGPPDPALVAPVLTAAEAERYCGRLCRQQAGNFYWGFLSLPRAQRMAVYALYDFARQVDDEVDVGRRSEPAAALELHRCRARACARGEWSDPVTLVLAGAVRRHAIPESELLALIDGVHMDLTRTRYATWAELEGYCRLVASTIGRMCVRIFGFEDERALARADDLGIALQLTNILRDVGEDGAMGRIYLPAEDLARFGVAEADLLAGEPGPGWEALVAMEVERAARHYAAGLEVLRLIPRRPAACVATMAGIYRRLLDMVAREPRLPLRRRASLSPARKLAVVIRSWARG